MQVPKEMVVERVRNSDPEAAPRAESELPDKVDTDQHGDLLRSLGVDPDELAGDLPGPPAVG